MSQKSTKCRRHPYLEERSPLEILVPSAVVSFALLFFFLWFQPDKVQSLESSRWIGVTGGLVLISFAIMSISQYLLRTIPRNFRLMQGELSQEAVFIAVSLLMLGVGIFVYFHLLGFIRLNPVAFLKIQMRTLLIGLSPMIVSTRFLAKDSGPSTQRFINGANAVVSLYSESGRECITVNLDDLLLVTSADNYVFIFTKSEAGVKRELLRTSLTKVEGRLRNYPNIFRCHRTAIVNLMNIKSATGNSQGYSLEFERVETTVPVARSRVRSFRQRCAISGCRNYQQE